jgi:hypothetical protein
MSSIAIGPFICPFCEHRTPLPIRMEGEAYEAIGMHAVNRCPCGSVAFCQADAWSPRGNWVSDELEGTLCRDVLKLEPLQCEVQRNKTTTFPAFEVIWAKPIVAQNARLSPQS